MACEAREAGKGIDDLEERAKACMKAAHNHWMATDETEQFNGAVAGLSFLSNEEEKERINESIQISNAFGAAMSGVPVDFTEIAKAEVEPIPLMKWWNEVKAQ